MNRRSLLQLLLSTPLLRFTGLPKCKLCGAYGHTHEEGSLESLYEYRTGTYTPNWTVWCKNAPVDWSMYRRRT